MMLVHGKVLDFAKLLREAVPMSSDRVQRKVDEALPFGTLPSEPIILIISL